MEKKGYLYAFIAVINWSTVASAFKISLRYMDFIHLLFFSSITSIIILFLVLLVQNKIKLLKEYSKKDYLSSILLGFLNPFLYYTVLFKAYSLLPAQEAQPLNYTWPIMLVLFSIPLLKQKIKAKNVIAIFISFIGILTISTEGNVAGLHFSNTLGVTLALSSSIIWALFWIYNVRSKIEIEAKLFLNFLFGLCFIIPLFIFFSKPDFPPMQGFLGAIYVGIFEMGITFLIWLKALKISTSAQVSNLIYLSPFISLILIHLIVGEKIMFSTIIGLIFIIAGIMIQQYSGPAEI